MSPEQVTTGTSDDTRSDVYAAGLVAFEMLTGVQPYVGDHAMSVAYQHVNSDVPAVSAIMPDVPAELSDRSLQPRDANPTVGRMTPKLSC